MVFTFKLRIPSIIELTNDICYIPMDRIIKGEMVTLANPVSWIILAKSCDQNNSYGQDHEKWLPNTERA